MIDFIEYVVTELKSRRLSREDATALVQQFAARGKTAPPSGSSSPMLRNTSTLEGIAYQVTVDGTEPFLRDHQVAGAAVLPAVVSLSLAREALVAALELEGSASLVLSHVAWPTPLILDGAQDVDIRLWPLDSGEIEFEVSTVRAQGDGEGTVHCHGRAREHAQGDSSPSPVPLATLRERLGEATLDASQIYARFDGMGLCYGPAHQAVQRLHVGTGEALGELQRPRVLAQTGDALEASLLDGALQCSIGLLWESLTGEDAVLPFALERARVYGPCPERVLVWVRESAASGDQVRKLDVRVCDEQGAVCVALEGFSTRVLEGRDPSAEASQRLHFVPRWQARAAAPTPLRFASHRVVLCELPTPVAALRDAAGATECVCLERAGQDIAARYASLAERLLTHLQEIFAGGVKAAQLLQVVVPSGEDAEAFIGLSAMLKTAQREQPQLVCQLVQVSPELAPTSLGQALREDAAHWRDEVIRHGPAGTEVQGWEELDGETAPQSLALKEDGVYVITGGLGGLGTLFAQEILQRCALARVVLTGRRAPCDQTEAAVQALADDRVTYAALALDDEDSVRAVLEHLVAAHGEVTGIFHCAGQIEDAYVPSKTAASLHRVLLPKVRGTYALARASAHLGLDFLLGFSSVASALGNAGQVDYAAANGFMDAYLSAVVDGGLTIHWPLWADGGIRVGEEHLAQLWQERGMRPLSREDGVRSFHQLLGSTYRQSLVLEGAPERLRSEVLARVAPRQQQADASAHEPGDESQTRLAAERYLREELACVLKLSPERIDAGAPLEKYGIDSILAMRLTTQLERRFGALPKTLFFEYQSIAQLAGYFLSQHRDALLSKLTGAEVSPPAAAAAASTAAPRPKRRRALLGREATLPAAPTAPSADIAIVGVSGRYPMAEDLDAFWQNLCDGVDCISDIPGDRWDWRRFFHPERHQLGKSYCRWGGFLNDVDKFDSLFFNISPREAQLMDPQERLFAQCAWHAVEDAGYRREDLSTRPVGVYVGVMYGQYELFAAHAIGSEDQHALPASSYASIANRVSYFLDLHGPSLAVDSMCSSSLSAIHLACDAIRSGQVEAAIAGGVNVSVHPHKYLYLSQGNFSASDGRCRSFGEGGDGYVPGEGVGAVILKPLAAAVEAGDRIYGVIKASALNHGGKTNGYSVPNPNAQGELVREALARAEVAPASISYVETHGTGTSLGDPIEIAGLSKAFSDDGAAPAGRCPIGSVKSNIGHLESAAGIAALTKVLLQLQHGKLVPSLHATPPNPNIDFARSRFRVQTELADWQPSPDAPRRAGISSFGAGGANAHLIIEEYRQQGDEAARAPAPGPQVLLLSAKTEERLRDYAQRLRSYLSEADALPWEDVCFTSQVARTAWEARLAVVADDAAQAVRQLDGWLGAERPSSMQGAVISGLVEADQEGTLALLVGAAGEAYRQTLIATRDLENAARCWVRGVDIDWRAFHGDLTTCRRVPFPQYPFAKDRHWVDIEPSWQAPLGDVPAGDMPAQEQVVPYHPHWQETPCHSVENVSFSANAVLVILGDRDRGESLRQATGKLYRQRAVYVCWGEDFAQLDPSTVAINPTREGDCELLAEHLAAEGMLPEVLLHLASDQPRDPTDAPQDSAGVMLVLAALLRAVLKRLSNPLQVISLYTAQAHDGAPASAGLAGFFRSLAQEVRGLKAKVVSLALAPISTDEEQAACVEGVLRQELSAERWPTTAELHYEFPDAPGSTSPVRFLRAWQAQAPLPAVAKEVGFRRGGVYLITGALGGLGRLFCTYLAERFEARLVLCGRSPAGERSDGVLAQLTASGAQACYVSADMCSAQDVTSAVTEAVDRFGALHGVIHCAGTTADGPLLGKTSEQMVEVVSGKTLGAKHLDLATQAVGLDLFILCSSLAGTMGNPGQTDYAYANRYLDAYAHWRASEASAGRRQGRTVAIAWPYWVDGGMQMDAQRIAYVREALGFTPLPTPVGLAAFDALAHASTAQVLVAHGLGQRMASTLQQLAGEVALPGAQGRTAAAPASPAGGVEVATAYLVELLAKETGIDPERVGVEARFESLGVDSVMINRMNLTLAQDLGPLPNTVLYEYETVSELAEHLAQTFPDHFAGDDGEDDGEDDGVATAAVTPGVPPTLAPPPLAQPREPAGDEAAPRAAMAIVGWHARLPASEDRQAAWERLSAGEDLVTEVPPSRWDWRDYQDDDEARDIYCRWGAFLEQADCFDAEFFGISPQEAVLMDPQERLFLESVWACMEDAGYSAQTLAARYAKRKGADVGVFVGVTTNSYDQLAVQHWGEGARANAIAYPWSIANRVSYTFDFQGPSLPVDTACSSSLVAVHLACESLRRGDCQVAIAGGVNLYFHPAKYHSLCQRGMLARSGHNRSFGAGDDGFVPGEAVGSVMLKPLARALEDGDHIHGVIHGDGYAHSGRANGYSAPNPNAQAVLIEQTLRKADFAPHSVSCVEAHGTATQMGDSLEVAALRKAFAADQDSPNASCALSSAKANLGHAESAAGVCALAKVLLQMQHHQFVPAINCTPTNEHIDLKEGPFFLPRAVTPWAPAKHPRRALINALGAGGVNACLALEEHTASLPKECADGPQLVVLSAPSDGQLREAGRSLVAALRAPSAKAYVLEDVAKTLALGRRPCTQRLAVLAASLPGLIRCLDNELQEPALPTAPVVEGDELEDHPLAALAKAWLAGDSERVTEHYSSSTARRCSLPGLPLMRTPYRMETPARGGSRTPTQDVLHPLISGNTSTFDAVSFCTALRGDDFLATDHRVRDTSVCPAAALLEIACAAGNLASGVRVVELRDVIWWHPVTLDGAVTTLQTTVRREGDEAEFQTASYDPERGTLVHSEGHMLFEYCSAHPLPQRVYPDLRAACEELPHALQGDQYYASLHQLGLQYGPAFQVVKSLHHGDDLALAQLQLGADQLDDAHRFLLHPALLDGALHSAVVLSQRDMRSGLALPFAVQRLQVLRSVPPRCWARVRRCDAASSQPWPDVQSFDIELLTEQAEVVVRIGGLSVRRVEQPSQPLALAEPPRQSVELS